MDFEATRDFKRARARVLARFRDPEHFEAVLGDIGARLQRTADAPQAAWEGTVMWRDEPRRFRVTTTEVAQDETIRILVQSETADADMVFDFYDLPDGGCRMIGKASIRAHTMIAKLAVKSMALVKGKAAERLGRFMTAMGRP